MSLGSFSIGGRVSGGSDLDAILNFAAEENANVSQMAMRHAPKTRGMNPKSVIDSLN
jgi:hypothetical protein